jgi:GNAT superfamily N-acetyltransferase
MRIRPAVPEDAMAVARVHVRSWQAAYRGLLPGAYLDALKPEDRAGKYNFVHEDPQLPYTLVGDSGGEIAGFATTMPARDKEMQGYGELCALYLDPDYWRRGLGSALHAAAWERLRSQGFDKSLLWVLQGNSRAERFYEAMGWCSDGMRRRDTIWDVEVEELRYVQPLNSSPGYS